LFATGFYDRVHDLKPHQMLESFPGQKPGNRKLYTGWLFSSKPVHKLDSSWYVNNFPRFPLGKGGPGRCD
jgi:hypothetical protein